MARTMLPAARRMPPPVRTDSNDLYKQFASPTAQPPAPLWQAVMLGWVAARALLFIAPLLLFVIFILVDAVLDDVRTRQKVRREDRYFADN